METLDQLINLHRAGHGLAARFYTSAEVFQLELKQIYQRHWLFAGHLSEIPNPGDFLTYQVGPESIIIVRENDHRINAFFNVCRHRGSPVCTKPNGNLHEFVCPYHAWAYDLSGRLLSAQRMGADFDQAELGLFNCHVEIISGLLFVCLGILPPSFSQSRESISRFITPHGLDRAKICYTLTQRIAANWKIVAENSWECYHCPVAHRLYSYAMPYSRSMASGHERGRLAALQREWETKTRSLGFVIGGIEPIEGGIVWCQRYPLRPGFVTQSLDGAPVAPLMGNYREYDSGVTAVQVFPACGFSVCNDYALLCRITPISLDLTEVKYYWLVDRQAREGVDYLVDRVTEFWCTTAHEDLVLCEGTQKGVSSTRYLPGPLGEVEVDVERFTEWYIAQLSSRE